MWGLKVDVDWLRGTVCYCRVEVVPKTRSRRDNRHPNARLPRQMIPTRLPPRPRAGQCFPPAAERLDQ